MSLVAGGSCVPHQASCVNTRLCSDKEELRLQNNSKTCELYETFRDHTVWSLGISGYGWAENEFCCNKPSSGPYDPMIETMCGAACGQSFLWGSLCSWSGSKTQGACVQTSWLLDTVHTSQQIQSLHREALSSSTDTHTNSKPVWLVSSWKVV